MNDAQKGLPMKTGMKHFVKKVLGILNQVFSDIFTLFIVVVKSNFFRVDPKEFKTLKYDELIVVGNGPSLNDTLKDNFKFFSGKSIACVNDFVSSEYFSRLKPDFYIFFDPAYWTRNASEELVSSSISDFKLLKEKVSWPLTIIMPLVAKRWNWFIDLPGQNKNIRIQYVNSTIINCSTQLRRFLFKHNLAMPRVVNVLVGVIFLAINMGYKKIYLVGADHSWHENIYLDDDNVLHLKYTHFYSKESAPLKPLLLGPEETKHVTMHIFFNALAQKFEGYQQVEDYSKFAGAKIYNASKKTYIDAFERYKI
jgi:hypothetical protein